MVALPGATDAAWPLARSVYASPSLRPASIDDARARALAGEAAAGDAPRDVRDLADTVAALRGDDAPSRALLADVARRLGVRAVVVVAVEASRPSARVFLADAGAFDAATYGPDDAAPASWSATVRSLARSFGAEAPTAPDTRSPPVEAHAPAAATRERPKPDGGAPSGRAFYLSGWFWGALGAAAFGAGAVFLATRDTQGSTIHLVVKVPQ